MKHPMLVGLKAWALGHLLANGVFGDVLSVGIGVIAYVAMLYLHPILIGVSVFG